MKQTKIKGTDPEAIPAIEEAAFELARLTEEHKALGKAKETAHAVLLARMEDHGLEMYSGIGVRCYVDSSIKAKVQVDAKRGEES